MNENNENEVFRDCHDDPDQRAPALRPSIQPDEESSESEDTYRRRVYGTHDKHELDPCHKWRYEEALSDTPSETLIATIIERN